MKKIILLIFFGIIQFMAEAQKPKVALNHFALSVINLQKSTSFYQNIIGLDTIPEPFRDGKHTWFKISELSQLHLIEGASEKAFRDKKTHLCFSVSSMNDMINILTKAGILYEDWPGAKNAVTLRPDGIKQIYFQDPDGNWIEVNDDHHF
jgi:lactoylglutathione lyase